MSNSRENPPSALLIVTPSCPHCSPVIDALAKMVKEGVVGQLEIINAAWHPAKAKELGVTSAPWSRIGIF